MIWATVTAIAPLRIQLDGDTAALPFTPDSLVDPGVLAVSDRVRCELGGRRVVVVGRAGGLVIPSASTTVAGIVPLATDAQAIAGTDTSHAVTPHALSARLAKPVQGQVPSSVVVGSGSALVAADGTVTFTGVSSLSLNGVFDGTGGDMYEITFDYTTASAAVLNVLLRASGTDAATAYDSERLTVTNATLAAVQTLNSSNWVGSGGMGLAGGRQFGTLFVSQPKIAVATTAIMDMAVSANPMTSSAGWYKGALLHRTASAYDGFSFVPGVGNITGTIKVVKIS